MKRMRMSFRAKIVMMCLVIVFLTAGSISFVTFLSMREDIRVDARDKLAEVARLNAELIARPFKQMANDAEIVAATPPVAAIMRARASGRGRAGSETVTETEWQTRFERIFASVLRQHPSYTQLRFIGIADGGREIVRVERAGKDIRIVPQEDLQQKGEEPYMARLRESVGPYFSELTYNREDGLLEEPLVPTVRLVHPVRTLQGALFGAIVINANYETVLDTVTGALATGYRLTVLNEAGDYIVVNADGTRSPLRLHDGAGWEPSDLSEFASATETRFMLDDRTAAYRSEVHILPQRSGMRLNVIASVPSRILLGPARAALLRTFALVVGLSAMTLLLAWVAADRLTQPLRTLISSIEARRSIFDPVEVDGTENDEIGQLARAYSDLANGMIRQAGESLSIFRNAADGILTVAKDGTILSANPAAHNMFRFADGDLPGRNIEQLIPHDSRERHREYMQLVREPNVGSIMGQNRDVFGLRKNAEKFPLEASLNAVTSGPETTYVVVSRDISVRKAQENTLRKTISELASTHRNLERSNRELDRFAYVASNGLKAPLRDIEAASWTLAEDIERHSGEEIRQNMQDLQDRIRRMSRLLDGLLQHARIGWEKFPAQTASGARILSGVIELAKIPEGFTIDIDPTLDDLELQIMPLQTVLLNLVQNAVKHHDKPNGRIRVTVREERNLLTFAVTDDGPGIDPSDHERVFKVFETLEGNEARNGSGIGLAIVKKTVELTGGKVTLVSAPGSGSSFRFTWPKSLSLQRAPGKAA